MALPSIDTALFNILDADAAITTIVGSKIYTLEAPPKIALPYIIYYDAAGIIPNRTPRDEKDDTYRVESRAVDRAGAEALHFAVYDALHEKELTLTGWTNYWLVCEKEQRFSQSYKGVSYFGYFWDVRIKSSKD